MKPLAVIACASLLAGGLAIVAAPAAQAATPDVIDLVQVTTNTTGAAAAVSLVPMLGDGTPGTAIALPTTASSGNKPFTLSGSAGSEGQLSLSADGRYLTLAGYAATAGTSNVAGTASAVTSRAVARVDASGNVDTSTSFDAFSGNNVRSATTNDGSRFWIAGANSTAQGAVVTATLGGSAATSVTTAAANARAVGIANGNLYLSSDKTKPTGVYQVGSGLPTASGQTLSALAGTGAPNGFALVRLAGGGTAPDTLYVADGSTGITKFAYTGTAWQAKGTIGSAAFGLTARVQNGGVQLYATSADGSKVYSAFDASGAGGTLTGTVTTVAAAPSGTAYKGVAFAPTGQATPGPSPVLTTDDGVLGNVVGDADNPALGVTLSDKDANVDVAALALNVATSNPAVTPLANIAVTGTGARRSVAVNPTGAGYSTITLSTTDPLGRTGSTSFTYGASTAAPDASSHWFAGAADSSAAIDAGDGYVLVADDGTNVLRLWRGDRSGRPVKTFDIGAQFGLDPTKGSQSMDLEAAARIGDTVWWTGSMGNSSEGSLRPVRSTLFATRITGSGANTVVTVVGSPYQNLRADLIAWDQQNGDRLGFAASAQDGRIAKRIDGFNVEGMEFAADGSGAGYVGFRAPLENTTDRNRALVVPVSNLASLTSSGGPATFGSPMLWDLGGLSIRDMKRNPHGQYLILAGSYGADDPTYRLYTWDGQPADQPVATTGVLPAPFGGWEAIVGTPDPIADGASLQLIEDDGSAHFYGDPSEAKDLALGLRKSRIDTVTLGLPAQSISFTTTPPAPARYGDSYRVAATGGASGLPVTFTTAGGDSCAITQPSSDVDAQGNGTGSAVVTLGDVGGCTVTAHQDGGASYQPATSLPQSFSVDPATPTIDWPTPDPITYGTAVGAAQLDATANVPGSITYDVSPGDVLDAGDHTVTATFTPTDGRRYTSASASVILTVTPATQSIDFAALADRTYGDAPVALHAVGGGSTAPVTFAATGGCEVTPTDAGPVLTLTAAGDCSVRADQLGDANHLAADPVTRGFTIARATPVLIWAPSADITYGTELGAAQLNASASAAGAIAYTADDAAGDATGRVLQAGTHQLHATFTPSSADYRTVTANVTLTVTQAHATLSWTPSDTALTYGDQLGAGQLNASADVPGTFTYDPAAGTVPHAGTRTLTATFTPDNANDYASGDSVTAPITVARAPQPLSITDPGTHRVGDDPFMVTATGGRSGSPVVFTASGRCALANAASSGDPVVGTVQVTITGAGNCTLHAEQDGSSDYLPALGDTVSLTVAKGSPALTWSVPDHISYGTAITSAQLAASASVPGRYAYTVDGKAYVAGTVPHAGNHTLGVAFTPSNTADYDPATANVTLVVDPAPQTVTIGDLGPKVYGAAAFKVAVSGGRSGKPVTAQVEAGSPCTVSAPSNGYVTVKITGAGTCTLLGNQAGTVDYAAAPTARRSILIARAATSATLGSIGTKTFGSAPFTISATPSKSTSPLVLAASPSTVCTLSGRTVTLTGPGTCTVTADQAGDANYADAPTKRVSFAVTYQVKAVSSLSAKAGSPLTIRLQLVGAGGANLSSPSVMVHAVGVDGTTSAPAVASQPNQDFGYVNAYSAFYEYVLDTRGMTVGTHTLTYSAGSDPVAHKLTFSIK